MDGRNLPDGLVLQDPGVDDRDQLGRLLEVLSARQRRVVVLRYFLDLSESEVAGELNISVGTVKSTASRALAALRQAQGETSTGRTTSGAGDEHTH